MTAAAKDVPLDGIPLRNRAVILSLLINVASIPLYFVLPGGDEAPAFAIVIGIVLGAIALLGAYGLHHGTRWGWITTIVVNALGVLSSLGAIGDWPSAWVGVATIAFAVVGIYVLVLLRDSRLRATLR